MTVFQIVVISLGGALSEFHRLNLRSATGEQHGKEPTTKDYPVPLIGALLVSLLLRIGLVGVSFGFLAQGSSDNDSIHYDSTDAFSEHSEQEFDFVWTKLGLEQIPFESWRDFSGDTSSSSLFIKDLPFPGEDFTDSHLDAWKANVEDDASIEDLLEAGYVLHGFEHQEAVAVFEDYNKVPSTYADPLIMEESLIDYRLQFATDIGSTMIGDTAAKGRLVSPAGRRLRKRFYRFPG